MTQTIRTLGDRIYFQVEVGVPAEQAEVFAAAMTNNDDDITLAAETAIRERLDPGDYDEEVELVITDESSVKRELRAFGEAHHHV